MAVVELGDFLDVIQTEAVTFVVVDVAGFGDSVKFIENVFDVLFGNADSVVGDGGDEHIFFAPGADDDVGFFVAIFECVFDEVNEDAFDVGLVSGDDGHFCIEAGGELPSEVVDLEGEAADDAVEEPVDVDIFGIDFQLAFFKLRELEDVGDHLLESFVFVADHRDVSFSGVGVGLDGVIRHSFAGEGDGGDGSFELVGHIVDEVVGDFVVMLLLGEGDDEDEQEQCQQGDDADDGQHDVKHFLKEEGAFGREVECEVVGVNFAVVGLEGENVGLFVEDVVVHQGGTDGELVFGQVVDAEFAVDVHIVRLKNPRDDVEEFLGVDAADDGVSVDGVAAGDGIDDDEAFGAVVGGEVAGILTRDDDVVAVFGHRFRDDGVRNPVVHHNQGVLTVVFSHFVGQTDGGVSHQLFVDDLVDAVGDIVAGVQNFTGKRNLLSFFGLLVQSVKTETEKSNQCSQHDGPADEEDYSFMSHR